MMCLIIGYFLWTKDAVTKKEKKTHKHYVGIKLAYFPDRCCCFVKYRLVYPN